MTETEQQAPGPSLQPSEIAAGIAKDAQENLAGLHVVNVSHMFADVVLFLMASNSLKPWVSASANAPRPHAHGKIA